MNTKKLNELIFIEKLIKIITFTLKIKISLNKIYYKDVEKIRYTDRGYSKTKICFPCLCITFWKTKSEVDTCIEIISSTYWKVSGQ